jgi:cobalt-zinc-cadmium efflux system protein
VGNTSGFLALSAHVLVESDHDDCHGVRRSLATSLNARFHIDHITLQVDHEVLELISIDLPK